jgi:hypothetical protein
MQVKQEEHPIKTPMQRHNPKSTAKATPQSLSLSLLLEISINAVRTLRFCFFLFLLGAGGAGSSLAGAAGLGNGFFFSADLVDAGCFAGGASLLLSLSLSPLDESLPLLLVLSSLSLPLLLV